MAVVVVVAVYQEFQAFLVVLVPRDQLALLVPRGTKVPMDPRAQLVPREIRATQEMTEAPVL